MWSQQVIVSSSSHPDPEAMISITVFHQTILTSIDDDWRIKSVDCVPPRSSIDDMNTSEIQNTEFSSSSS
jgi:hypothetical protein